jgi:hypothetical protein
MQVRAQIHRQNRRNFGLGAVGLSDRLAQDVARPAAPGRRQDGQRVLGAGRISHRNQLARRNPAVDTSHGGQAGDTVSRQRSSRLRSELHGTGTYPGGVNSRPGRDLTAGLATVVSEITRMRQIVVGYLDSSDRDA